MTVVARGRALAQADLPAIHALHLATVGAHPPMSRDELASQLWDVARARGRQVVVAVDRDAVVGCAGWVEAPPWCYGAPVFAATPAAARFLAETLVSRARACGASRARVSVFPGEDVKRAALAAAGFAPAFDFVTVARRRAPGDGARWAGPWRRVPYARLEAAALRDVHDDSFAGVANSAPLELDAVRELLDGPGLDRDATCALADADGRYAAFVVVLRDADADGPFAVIDMIGVRAGARRRGLAAALLDDALARVDAPAVRALIASTNAASLALHASRGFTEVARRTVVEATV